MKRNINTPGKKANEEKTHKDELKNLYAKIGKLSTLHCEQRSNTECRAARSAIRMSGSNQPHGCNIIISEDFGDS